MKKRLFTALLAVGLGLTACGGDPSPGTSPGETGGQGGKKIRLALVMSHQTNAFTTTFANAAKEEAAAQGVELTVLDAKKDTATQITLIETAVTQGYDGIMVEPNAVDGLDRAAKAAKDAGIPFITVIQQMSNQDMALAYVGGDDEEAGKLQMEESLKLIGSSGDIALIYGPMGSDAQIIRKKGYDKAMQGANVKIAFESSGNWVTEEGLKLAENWLGTGTDLKAIVAQNDSMAIGAAKAAANAGKDIVVTGVDATPEGLDAVRSGALDGTVSQDTPGMGKLSVQTMLKIIKGEKVDKEVRTSPKWITKDNVDQA